MICNACSAANAGRNLFCGRCGVPLEAVDPAHVQGSWAELKHATVLFADVVGSTELVAALDAEEAMTRLHPALLRMRECVEQFGGYVVRTLGDGIMALFGAPNALEGHARLACQAALHMQASFRAASPSLSIRVGLNSGRIASEPQGAHDGQGGGVHGLIIHVASRIMALAPAGGICLTEACSALAGDDWETVALGRHAIKGFAEPVPVLALQGLQPATPRSPATRSPMTTFRGRTAELWQLEHALTAVSDGEPVALGIRGEAGVGKSRLCREFLAGCRARGVPVHEACAQMFGHSLPLAPMVELFRAHFLGVSPGDQPAEVRECIAHRFAAMRPSAQDLQILFMFFGVDVAGAAPPTLGANERNGRLLALLRALVRSDPQVLRVVLIEDLHWLDERTREFTAMLVEAVAGTKTLLLMTYRGDYACAWRDAVHFSELQLAELGAAEMDALVAELLSRASGSKALRRIVCRRAHGNPFFAEELVRLAQAELPADAAPPALERALPATIEAVVAARIDRLAPREKRVLHACAIVGKEIPFPVLRAVARDVPELDVAIERLCGAGLLMEVKAGGVANSLAFRHPLIQEVAYGTQLKARRIEVHAAVAEALEAQRGETTGDDAACIAWHYEVAQRPLEAARHFARAAAWSAPRDGLQSIRQWRKVRAVLAREPRSAQVDRLRATAAAKIALLGWREGMTAAEAKLLIDDALALSHGSDDDGLVPWLLTIEGRMLLAAGGAADGYVECVKKGFSHIDAGVEPGRFGAANAFLSHALSVAGLLREALAANTLALRDASRVELFDREFIGFDIELWALFLRARVLGRMGRMAEARECLVRTIELEHAGLRAPIPGMSHLAFVEVAWATQDEELAQRHVAQLEPLLQRNSTPYLRTHVETCRGVAKLLAADCEAAVGHFRIALGLLRESRAAVELEPELLVWLAECAARGGLSRAAYEYADEAVVLSRQRTSRLAECGARILRGEALLALREQPAAAELDFVAAQQLIHTTGALPWARALAGARDRARITSWVPVRHGASGQAPSFRTAP